MKTIKPSSGKYVELLCKSNFSFLRGASDSRLYVAKAAEYSMPALGVCDLNGVYALPRAYEACKYLPQMKLICGAEVVIKNHPNLSLIAEDRDAYGVLCKILTAAHADKEKGEAFLTLEELKTFMGNAKAEGLVAIPKLTSILNSNERAIANNFLKLLKELFSSQLYLPLCRYLDGLDNERTEACLEQALKFNLKIIATNDVHYHEPSRRMLQDCLTCIREGVKYREAGLKLFGNEERYLKSPLQMKVLFNDLPQALENTVEIASGCSFSLSQLTYRYPNELIPEGHTPQSYFEELVTRGAHKIYRGMIPRDVDAQIQHEFKLIRKMNYASYFLTIYDIVEFARSKNIIAQGRGSAANSICCYCLGITAIDPVRMKLLFERFISEERSEPPDIDVDFEHERREEVIQYVYERYGRDHAGMVSAVRTYQKRSAFLELSKAIGVEVGTISAGALKQDFEKLAGNDADKRDVVDSLCDEIVDAPRHLSIHSGGFTLSADPIIETVPIEPARMEGRTIIQWDKNDLDTTGLLKVDLLSLGFLTALHKMCDYLGIDWRDIPPEDPKTYQMICRAETEGTFQLESRAQKSILTRSMPSTFYDLVVQVAIVRPGPNVGEMIHPYIKRKEESRRGNIYTLEDPDLQKILGRTFGVPIFQEQIMKLAIVKGGFTAGEADQLRRALASYRSAEDVMSMGTRLYEGLLKNGVSKEYADELFGYVKGYSHYGFPESHAASFALISYKSAYLKCHHPAEFLCGLINSQPMGFYPVHVLINDAKRNGVVVLPTHPNKSEWDATMESIGSNRKAVRMGFRNVRKIKKSDVEHLVKERRLRPFSATQDFIKRNKFSRDVIEILAMADVFKVFGEDQRHSFWQSIEFKTICEPQGAEQLSLFEEPRSFFNEPPTLKSKQFNKMTLFEEISTDYRTTGYSLRGNIMRAIRSEDNGFKNLSSSRKLVTSLQIKNLNGKRTVTTAGVLIVMQRPPTAKGVCFITLEDEFGSIDLILKKETYEKYQRVLSSSRFLMVSGKLQSSGTGRSVLVDKVEALTPAHLATAQAQAPHVAKPIQPGSHPRELGQLVR